MKNYPFNMIKEIEESPEVLRNLLKSYTKDGKINLDTNLVKDLQKADDIIFLACGTSYHASHVGMYLFRKMGKMSDCYIASEWAYNPVIYGKNPVYVLVSQSGETADIIACKKHLNGPVVSITNCRESTIDKMGNYILPLDCGKENAIAATKSYIAQVAMVVLLAKAAEQDNNAVVELNKLISAIEEVVAKQEIAEKIADDFVPAKSAFFLGRSVDHFAAMEGSLKLKETCYIHSEAYPGGELKHGPVALVEKGMPVVGLISDDQTAELFRKNLKDIEDKEGTVVIVSSKHLAKDGDAFVTPDVAYYLEPAIKVVVLQLIAYNTSKKKGLNVDNPRSLVKAVVTE